MATSLQPEGVPRAEHYEDVGLTKPTDWSEISISAACVRVENNILYCTFADCSHVANVRSSPDSISKVELRLPTRINTD